MKKYDFFSDPGHGWLKVKRQELIDFGIEGQISGYSYQRGDYVYLEEDADASLFQEAWEHKHQRKLMNEEIRYYTADRDSKIRRYEPFKPSSLVGQLRRLQNQLTKSVYEPDESDFFLIGKAIEQLSKIPTTS